MHDAALFEADVFDVGHNACRTQHHIAFKGFFAFLGLHRDLASLARGVDAGDFRVGHDVDARLLERPLKLLGDFLVFHRHNAVHILHHGHFCADGVVEVGELHADGAGTDDHHFLWLLLQGHGFAVADDLFAVLRHGREFTRSCARGDDDVVGFEDGLGAVGGRHFELLAGQQLAVAHDHIDVVLLHEERDAFAHAVCHASAALDHAAEVGLGGSHTDAVVLCVFDVLKHVGALQQRLCGDAPPVQANAAKRLALHDCGFQTQLRCADGGHISAGSASKNNHVVLHAAKVLPQSIPYLRLFVAQKMPSIGRS